MASEILTTITNTINFMQNDLSSAALNKGLYGSSW
jgi:hypothetical protein